MNQPDNQPSSRPPSLYEMSKPPERRGGGGIIVLVLLLILLGGAAAYYFLVLKKQPATPVAATLPAAATPRPVAAATPPLGYNSVTEQSYIDQADKAFTAIQGPKIKAFSDAYAEFKAAGYVNPAGLTTKEALAARRALIAKVLAANDDYAAFVGGEEATYRDALASTPLTPADAKATLDQYVAKAKPQDVVKLRQAEHDYLKSCDDMMALLEKWSGNWSFTPAGKLNFKRKENTVEYNELAQKCNAEAAEVSKLQNDYNASFTADSGPAATDSPAAAAAPGATPAASVPASPAPVPAKP